MEIDASALRFDVQETRNFLEIERFGTLVPSDLRLLHEKTEGWAGRPADCGVDIDSVEAGFRAVRP